jgi:hypothetical protein
MKTQFPGAVNRFEDYLGTHIVQTDFKHFTGDFQPWVRAPTARFLLAHMLTSSIAPLAPGQLREGSPQPLRL